MSLKHEIQSELIDWLILVLAIAAMAYFSFCGMAEHQPARYYGGLDTISTIEEVQR